MSGREQEFIQEAFDTNWVVPLGPNVNAFEQSLRDFLIENGELKIKSFPKPVSNPTLPLPEKDKK